MPVVLKILKYINILVKYIFGYMGSQIKVGYVRRLAEEEKFNYKQKHTGFILLSFLLLK
jgi:hypothetical protein